MTAPTNKTTDVARRLLKSRMQQAICRAKLAESPDNERIWGSMLNLSDGFVEKHQQQWEEHCRNLYAHEVLPHILEAVALASIEARHPYREHCDPAWLKKVIDEFLSTFDPMLMTPHLGEA